jgi:oxysterol-binding protein-related protein 9/10/11
VRHLEETISQNTDNRSGCIDNSLVLYKHSVSNQKNLLRIFDRKVSEADVYLQLIIERICTLEKRIAEIEDPEVKSCYITLQQQFSKMLDSIKHSIVLLQISKNTAVPINGTFTGDKLANGEDAQSSQGLDIASKVFPDTSYSSSEGEDDYFDAHDDSLPSHAVSPTNM